MPSIVTRRLFILQASLAIAACTREKTSIRGTELVIGVISYGESKKTIERFARFRKYLGEKTGAIIRLEPAFNENIAIQGILNHYWSLVFATPGLAAFAKAKHQYLPIFPLQIDVNSNSILIVRLESPLKNLKDLQDKTVALGIAGSATGYYFPLYNLYGLTLASILEAPLPETVLEWVAQGKADAGAVSSEELRLHRKKFPDVEFRILFTDTHNVPSGSVLIGPNVERSRQDLIRKHMIEAPLNLIQEIGYVPNGKIPDYKHMISVVNRVTAINGNLRSKPIRIF
jgi:phosphonate transport system substrate-binding protein